MTKGAWRRSLLGRGVDVLRRSTPRLQRLYAELPASAGLAPDATPDEHEQRLLSYYGFLRDHAPSLPDPPRFSVVMRDGPGAAETVASLRLQLWDDWELIRPPGAPRVNLPPEHVQPAPPTGDYVIEVDAGDRLYPNALSEVVRAIDLHRRLTGETPRALYTDERTIDATGRMSGDPIFKPGFSPRLLSGGDYIGGLAIYDRALLEAVGGLATSRWETARRAAAVAPFRQVPHVLVQRLAAPEMQSAPAPPFTGSVSVVIPSRDQPELLEACLRSVLERSSFADLEVIVVDNGTTDPSALAVLDRHREQVRIVAAPGPFNFARLCNLGVAAARGDVVVLLNNDTEVVTADWLQTIAGWAAQDGVGAVGPMLLYPDGRIQHAGLAGFAEAGTGHLFVARDPAKETPLGLARAAREVLAVTGACLAVRRDHYLAVGQLDEWVVPNDGGDVDLCLRLREAGLVNMYTPDAVLIHHESPSRGRSFVDFERFYLQRRWPAELLSDPYLNPNLAKSTRYEADPRFGVPEVPPDLFAVWLSAGQLPLSS